MKRKLTIGIDASSNAIGIAIYMDKDLYGHYTVYPNKDTLKDVDKRVTSILNNFKLKTKNIMIAAERHGNTEFILNLGYHPTNGVNKSNDSLKIVESVIKYEIMKRGMKYTSILDSSWQHKIGVTGKLKRSEKKMKTVEFFANVIAGLNNSEVIMVTHKTKNIYRIELSSRGVENYVIETTDDEADAAVSAWMVIDGNVNDQQLVSTKEANKIKAVKEIKNSIRMYNNMIERKNKKIISLNTDIKNFKLKLKAGDNKTYTKAINNRKLDIMQYEEEIKNLESQISDLYVKRSEITDEKMV